MKTKIIKIISILLWAFSLSAQESPYSIFGDNTPTLGMRNSNKYVELSNFKCVVCFKDGSVGFIEFDFKAKIAKLKNSEGNELQQTNITPSDIARFTTLDPKAELYPSISPYVYCAGNPIRFIDPTGMFIEEGSMKDWNRMRTDITKERDRLVSQIENIQAKAAKKGWDERKLQRKLGNRMERVESLNGSLATMDVLEVSTQGYMLNNLGPNQIGDLKYNSTSGLIGINYSGVANFVHEMTHAGQFEVGAIAFSVLSGKPRFQDVYDEVAAYQAQYAYSPSSVASLVPRQFINAISEITPGWVQSIPVGGKLIYAPDGINNTGIYPVGIYSTPTQINSAFPLQTLPPDYNPLFDPFLYYKR